MRESDTMQRKLTGWCTDCLGCSRLEDENFIGMEDCGNYVPMEPRNKWLEDIINKSLENMKRSITDKRKIKKAK